MAWENRSKASGLEFGHRERSEVNLSGRGSRNDSNGLSNGPWLC